MPPMELGENIRSIYFIFDSRGDRIFSYSILQEFNPIFGYGMLRIDMFVVGSRFRTLLT